MSSVVYIEVSTPRTAVFLTGANIGSYNQDNFWVSNSELQGNKDGLNTEFKLSKLPVSDKETIFLNGLALTRDIHYTIDGLDISLTDPPVATDKLVASFIARN